MWMRHLPWMLAIAWLGVRIFLGNAWDVDKARNAGVLINILFVLLLVFFGINKHYRQLREGQSSFFEDLKACMKPALLYVVLAVAALGVYYGMLSNDIAQIRTARIEQFNTLMSDDSLRTAFFTDHPELAAKSREELIATNKENIERNVSVSTALMGGLLALTFIGFAYSLLAVFFWRTFVRK
jgi:hypothetical protein